ncbi:MAG: response regulator, partial [bacterium]
MANERILIVDDEADIREFLSMRLKLEGYSVLEAGNGAEAVVVAKEQTPDLIVLDIMMPEMDGIEVVNRLRGSFATRNIPVILLSAKCSADDKLTGLGGGANDYVTKPFNLNELVMRVQRMLEWSNEQRSVSPLTGLPGNHAINKAIRARLAQEQPFGRLQIDIDHFKAFNDYYGYGRGDEAIQLLAFIARDAVTRMGGPDGFVGHIGGD